MMENSTQKSGGIVTPKRNGSMDLKSLNKSKISKVGETKKRISDKNVKENSNNKKRKGGKEVSLSRFESSAKKSRKKDVNGVKLEFSSRQKSACGSEGSQGISLALGHNGSGFHIPKRPRGSARKKKKDIDKIFEPLGLPKSFDHVGASEANNVIPNEDTGPINRLLRSVAVSVDNSGVPSSKSRKNDINSNLKSKKKGDSKPTLSSSSLIPKVKRTADNHEVKESSDGHGMKAPETALRNGDTLSAKTQSNTKKRKNFVAGIDGQEGSIKFSKTSASSGVSDSSLINFLDAAEDDDDEENLEQNAARMLSSRFDPTCTGFSSKRISSSPQAAKGFSCPVSSARASLDGEAKPPVSKEYAQSDDNNRAIRPISEDMGKGASRESRQYYELHCSNLDAYWVLERRIKIFWPSDENWHDGLVNDYQSQNKLHHIKYDDRDEEWVDLQKEKFKLFLLPSEVPGKTKSRKCSKGFKNVHTTYKVCPEEDDSSSDNFLDSEPIASWLSSSSQRVKALPRSLKNQKSSQLRQPLVSSFSSEKAGNSDDKVVDSDRSKSKSNYKSAFEDNLVIRGMIDESLPESTSSHQDGKHIVYVRKKFRSKVGTSSLPRDVRVCGNAFPLANVDLRTILEGKHFYEFRILIALPIFRFSDYSCGKRDFQLLLDTWMHQHGVLTSTSPAVILEMLFIDSDIGLRFFLFDGCMKQALAFVVQILNVFDQVGEQCVGDMKLPVTSLKFGFYHPRDQMKQHVFALAFYSFARLQSSRWCYLETILQHCSLIKELQVSDCTYDSVKEFERETLGRRKFHVDLELVSVKDFSKKLVPGAVPVGVSSKACDTKMAQSPFGLCTIPGEDTSSMPLFFAAQSFFLSLHLQSLVEHSVVNSPENLQCSAKVVECAEFEPIPLSSQGVSAKHGIGTLEKDVLSLRSSTSSEKHFGMDVISVNDVGEAVCSENLQNGTHVYGKKVHNFKEIPEISREIVNQSDENEALDKLCKQIDVAAPPSLAYPISSSKLGKGGVVSSAYSPLLPGVSTNFCNGFSSGPKRPRTQVHYTLPSVGYDFNPKQKARNLRSLPCKRIRRACFKMISDGSRDPQKKFDLLVCVANVLVTNEDQGWRDRGAQIVLEVADHNEWRVAVRVCGVTKYSYKVKNIMQPGSTNRFTHAMMWRGGKDWVLEFPDRNQWLLFKEMHEECYNRNIRAASVKNIPIPGVRLVEESNCYGTGVHFIQNPTKYIRQFQSDVQRALDPSRVLYDMDSDDEQWLMVNKSCNDSDNEGEISEELFEKIMDMFEKVSYVQLRDNFTETEIEELVNGVCSLKASKVIYKHWQQKRERKGMPLIRHLQPPLWERYEHQLREWEHNVRGNYPLSDGRLPPEKPPMFAFCQKPRDLDVPNKGSKHRSHRRNHHTLSHDDGFLLGRKSYGYAFRAEQVLYPTSMHYSSDVSPALYGSVRALSPLDSHVFLTKKICESNPYQKVYKNRPRNLVTCPSFSNSERTMGNRNRVKQLNMILAESSAHGLNHLDGLHRERVDQLNALYLDEFRLRDAANAAKRARDMVRLKREKAQRLLKRADIAINKAVVALMTAEAIKDCI